MSASDHREMRVRPERKAVWTEAMASRQREVTRPIHHQKAMRRLWGVRRRGEAAQCGSSIADFGAWRIVWDLDWESDLDGIEHGKPASGGTSWGLASICRCCVN